VGVFFAFFHWQILGPTNVGWLLHGDWGAHLVGWTAFQHDIWRWPLGRTELLAAPVGVSVTYTDSNPLLCLLLKPFAALLPTPFQFTGAWLASCVALQFLSAWVLLGPAVRDRWLRLLGATLFTLVPTFLNRVGHPDLCAHWTILLSLHAFLNVPDDRRRDLWHGLLIVVSALVHPYLLLMNAAIWASSAMRTACERICEHDLRGLGGLAWRGAAVILAPLLALWLSGGLTGFAGDAGGFGDFAMPLDALFNPGRPGYSRLLPIAPQTPSQMFEGFQYLGAGLLLLVAAALASLAFPAGRRELSRMRLLAWLAPALLVLFALSLSDDVRLHGRVLVHVDYDWIPFHLTHVFRASGRLFWPCAYVLLLMAVRLVFALPAALAFAIGLSALALQVADLSVFAATVKERTLRAVDRAPYTWTLSPKWDALVASADRVEFEPPDAMVDLDVFSEIAIRAVSMRRPVNTMYAARIDPRQRAVDEAARHRFLRGDLDPHTLYVLSDGCAPPASGGRAAQVNRVVVIPPAVARYPFRLHPADAPVAFPIGTAVRVSHGEPALRCLLAADWSGVEGDGVWSDGARPQLLFHLPAPPAHDLQLTMDLLAFPPEGQTVTVEVAGRSLGRFALRGALGAYQVRIPRNLVAGSTLDLVLAVAKPVRPSELGGSVDIRLLGVKLSSVRLDVAP
jgi:hypothetical protein